MFRDHPQIDEQTHRNEKDREEQILERKDLGEDAMTVN